MPSPPAAQDHAGAGHGQGPAGGPSGPSRRRGRPRHRRRRSRLAGILLAAGVTLVLVAGLALAGSIVAVHRYDRAVDRDTLLAPSARAPAPPRAALRGPLNFLLIGSDYRTWNPQMGQRSDTIIIAHVAAGLDRAYLVSIPRDLRVTMPPAASFPGATTKINAAFEYGGGGTGGIQLLSSTLTELTGVHFDGAAVVNFTGLQRAVAVLGGVTLCVDERTVSVHTGAVFEPGCRPMNPAQTLDYLRQRQFADGDFTRQRHQQQFLKALMDKAVSTGTLANPIKLDGLLRAVANSMTIDIGGYSLTDLVFGLRGLRPDEVSGIRVPSRIEMIGDTSYVIATDEAPGLYAAIRGDRLDAWMAAHPNWVNRI